MVSSDWMEPESRSLWRPGNLAIADRAKGDPGPGQKEEGKDADNSGNAEGDFIPSKPVPDHLNKQGKPAKGQACPGKAQERKGQEYDGKSQAPSLKFLGVPPALFSHRTLRSPKPALIQRARRQSSKNSKRILLKSMER